MDAIAQVDAAEDRLVAAQVAHDVAELDALLHDELVWTDPLGGSGGKELDLQAHRDEAYTLTRFDVESREYDMVRDDVVVARVRMLADGEPISGPVLYTRVWVCDDGAWRVRAAHVAVPVG